MNVNIEVFVTIITNEENMSKEELLNAYKKLKLEKENDYCRDCHNCKGCKDCHNCHYCQSCYNCYDCYDCKDCNNCYICHSCDSCNNCHMCILCIKLSEKIFGYWLLNKQVTKEEFESALKVLENHQTLQD